MNLKLVKKSEADEQSEADASSLCVQFHRRHTPIPSLGTRRSLSSPEIPPLSSPKIPQMHVFQEPSLDFETDIDPDVHVYQLSDQ